MTALWISEAADHFWAEAGGAPDDTFPRDLRRAVAHALPLAVVDLPRLGVSGVEAWLERRGLLLPVAERDRPLRACLLAGKGAGIVFLDGADPDDERRFSLAHEVAHFLVDYVLPRQQVQERLGPRALAVLDGDRQASRTEQIDAVLAAVPLGLRLHIMERTSDGHHPHHAVSVSEQRADALALELLAPASAVRARLDGMSDSRDVERLLRTTFGLPSSVARTYARQLRPRQAEAPTLLRRVFGDR